MRMQRGRYASTDLTVGMGKDARPGQFYHDHESADGKDLSAQPRAGLAFFPETMAEDNCRRPDYLAG